MQISEYVIYELLIRLQELNPGVGEYVSNRKTEHGILVRTSTGVIPIPEDILLRQHSNPTGVNQQEILNLLGGFKLSAT